MTVRRHSGGLGIVSAVSTVRAAPERGGGGGMTGPQRSEELGIMGAVRRSGRRRSVAGVAA